MWSTRRCSALPTSPARPTRWDALRGRALADGGCRVALAHAGKGNQAAAVLTERAVALFAPAAVIFVGVAGALSPPAAGRRGGGPHVYAYHGAYQEDDRPTARPRTGSSHTA